MLLKYSLNTIALYMLLDNNQGQAESQQHKASDIEPTGLQHCVEIFAWNVLDKLMFLSSSINIQYDCVNHLGTNLKDLNFHPLQIVSRYRDPQFQVGENYS